ncbi:6-bladed beta-propeller [Neolewinella agarilytica]|uniref:6-bladed beta-propeller protein n=1 Tax=Neolewinella agarilytica TaxID=478744 RepID=A0A1H9P3S6_9BACT|nr:6-bladed beta-propeller [Neolewinella agarilytica]SER42565.1 6-bladed beta-propeller protein [Neolewinella agarilytica]
MNLKPLNFRNPSFVRRTIFLLLFASLLFTCEEEESVKGEFVIDVLNLESISPENVFLNPIAVPLELTSESAIKVVTKIIATDENYFVLDERSYTVFIFDSTGKYVSKIVNTGDGPNSIDIIYDIRFNLFTPENEIELMSPKGKVVSYDLDSKEYKTIIGSNSDLNSIYGFINVTNDISLFYTQKGSHKLTYYSREKGEVIDGKLKNNTAKMVPLGSPCPFLAEENDPAFFLDQYTSEVYEIDGMELIKLGQYDFVGQNLSIPDLPLFVTDPSSLADYTFENNLVYPIVSYRRTKKSVGMTVVQSGKSGKTLVFDKASGWRIVDRIDKFRFNPFISTMKDKTVGVLIDPTSLYQIFPNIDDSLIDDFDVEREMNPILITYSFLKE